MFVAARSGSSLAEVGGVFGVEHFAERFNDFHLAEFFRWSLEQIGEMTHQEYLDAFGYIAGMNKARHRKPSPPKRGK